jgi:hypothetical protein
MQQGQFYIYWAPANLNHADYFTKHHATQHHRTMRHHYLNIDLEEQAANAITLIATFAPPCMTCEGVLNPSGHHTQFTQAEHASQQASQHTHIHVPIGDSGACKPSFPIGSKPHYLTEIISH